ncbi:lopap-like [Hyposmocoma kahamanoa]|uniref:lopap-like n=1 Tax=Hyposmocoma kahamanoa TaxID=1477025 RepID=UPI000E6D8178|nr:lopap-like [Hyposmocoma kahamanoa]
MLLFILACVIASSFAAEFTLPGKCPNVTLQDNFDFSKFAGTWYTTSVFASDGRITYDCAVMVINEDNVGYTLKESYVELDDSGERIEKSYFARVDPTFDAEDSAKFIVSHEDGDKVLQFPFAILSTDYDTYAVAYTCQSHKKRIKMHYVYAWILSRQKEKLKENAQNIVEEIISQHTDLAANREFFVNKDFGTGCTSTQKSPQETFTNNFW